jgi:hypothetical protein
MAIAEMLTEGVLRSLVIGNQGRLPLAWHRPERHTFNAASAGLNDSCQAVEVSQPVKSLQVNPLKEVAVVAIDGNIAFHRNRLGRELRLRCGCSLELPGALKVGFSRHVV